MPKAEATKRGAGRASRHGGRQPGLGTGETPKHLTKKAYQKELRRLQVELVQFEEWVRLEGRRVVVVFEGRDTAGKGGMIKRIRERLNPRVCRTVALPAPSEREKTQWYFQRYVAHLPAAGEVVLYDRSWYNRADIERVMGYCTDAEYHDFMRSCPPFEHMLINSGIVLLKYWLSVSDEEQERRFQARLTNPAKRWKLSPIDLQSRAHWVDYSEAKDGMFAFTDTKEAPWHVVETDSKRTAHLNLITHLLQQLPYRPISAKHLKLPPRQRRSYQRPPKSEQTMVPTWYVVD
ncbi:MAG: polyphosphate kinase 2 [Candidatus Dormiibacterota bacterium]